MPFFAYVLVMIVAVGSVLFGVEVITTPPQKTATETTAPSKLAQREADQRAEKTGGDASKPLTPVYPTSPGSDVRVVYPPSNQTQAAASETTGVAPADEPKPQPVKATQDAQADRPVQAVAEHVAAHCDVQTCAGAYASFRASDCTYQPYQGPRRACVTPPQQRSAVRNRPRDELPNRITRVGRPIAPRDIEPAAPAYANGDEDDGDDSYAGGPADGSRMIVIQNGRRWP